MNYQRFFEEAIDQVHAEVPQVGQFLDGGVEGAAGGKRADVQFVDHTAG